MANLINFQTTTTTRISPINNAQRGTTMPKSSIYLTKYKSSTYHLNIVTVSVLLKIAKIRPRLHDFGAGGYISSPYDYHFNHTKTIGKNLLSEVLCLENFSVSPKTY